MSQKQEATGTPIAASSPWASTAGGPTRATRSTAHRGWRESGCTGMDARSTGLTSARYALHRNGYAGMQRYAGFLWSGDVYSTWPTLANPRAGGDQHRPDGNPVLGHGYRRLCPDPGI